jgi:hydrogenase large subunit
MDTVMSHITHLYHLSALDFINASVLGAPWTPSYTSNGITMLTCTGYDESTVTNKLVFDYVAALAIRRKCHTAGALFSGRQPISNALVPGGATSLFSNTVPKPVGTTDSVDLAHYDGYGPYNATETRSKFKSLLTEIRQFINTKYIPDVVTVASVFSNYWNVGTGCQNLLAYGDFPVNSTGTLAIKRGIVQVLTPMAFDQARIKEYVDNSYYDYGFGETGLHPFSGETSPHMKTSGYSWLKAPRYDISAGNDGSSLIVCEVGPLARMVNTYVSSTQPTTTETDLPAASRLGTYIATSNALANYNVKNLVDAALAATIGGANIAKLYSPLGRHAARALEAKYLADLIAGGENGGSSWIDQLVADDTSYTYVKIPKQISTGHGLCEAPRGALGHWIKIEGRKVAKYQCVVPTTWNGSPAHGTTTAGSTANRGAIEQSIMDTNIGTTDTAKIVNILRVIHPFDICIACAVHVVNPEGKETLRFAIDVDGKPKNVVTSK